MVRDELFGGVVLQRSALQTCNDTIRGIIDLVHGDSLLVAASCQNGRLVHQVLQICTAEARGSLGNIGQRDLLLQFLVADVDIQNLLAALDIWQAHGHASVETSWPQERIVQDVGSVCGSDDDDTAVAFKAVHLCQNLVQSLLSLIVSTSHAGSSLTSNSIDLINEDNAWGLLLGLLEDVSHSRGSNAHKQLDELGSRRLDERHARFAGQRLCHQRLSCARRSSQQDSPRDLCAHFHEPLWSLQKIHDFHELLLGLVNARHILKLHASLRLDHDFRLTLVAESWNTSAARCTGA
mmetsp:Transcript_7684/g.13381  ORF Transcript_7684/g.13381 Transcript_7684/m.13381 type:complete len:294 (-) Transcript_7684:2466-3347(-)